MDYTELIRYLTDHLEADGAEIAAVVEGFPVRQVKKGRFLLRPGEICRHSFFVEKGLLRQYSIDVKGKEHLLQFGPENWFVTDRESAFFHQPSAYFIQAYEDSRVVMLDESFVERMIERWPAYSQVNSRLLHNHVRHLQTRITLLLSATAEERYLHFVSVYPDILSRVPQAMVASYLGMTPESLSRVRRRIAERGG